MVTQKIRKKDRKLSELKETFENIKFILNISDKLSAEEKENLQFSVEYIFYILEKYSNHPNKGI